MCAVIARLRVYIDSKQISMIKIDSFKIDPYFVQHKDSCVTSPYHAQMYPPTHVVFVFSDYLHITQETSTFNDAYFPSAPTFNPENAGC